MSDKKVQPALVQTMLASLTFEFARIGDSTTTVCEAFLPNGFSVGSGKSACVDPANFDYELGCKYAKENAEADAKNTIWQLEGYLLKVTGHTSDSAITNPAGWKGDLSKAGQCMTFGQALHYLKEGHKVAREGWNGKDMFLKKIPAGNASFIGLDMQDCIGMKTAQGVMQPGWLASQNDMLANDWLLVE